MAKAVVTRDVAGCRETAVRYSFLVRRVLIPLPFNRVVLFLITLLQITIICLGNYITPNQTMPHGELNTQRLLKGHTVKSSPPHIYILIYNGHQISLV